MYLLQSAADAAAAVSALCWSTAAVVATACCCLSLHFVIVHLPSEVVLTRTEVVTVNGFVLRTKIL